MNALTFKAVLAGVHLDPKKKIVKIQLEVTSYVSLDALTTLALQDEGIQVVLESPQATIIEVGDEAAERSNEEYAGDDK